MIIFDLETLADDSHRRHFIDPEKNSEYSYTCYKPLEGNNLLENWGWWGKDGNKFQPDYKSYWEACMDDRPIEPVHNILHRKWDDEGEDVEIWTFRSMEFKYQTIEWINKKLFPWCQGDIPKIKMRPIENTQPAYVLKEIWLRSECQHISLNLETGKEVWNGHNIDFIFESDPESISMFRSHGIFVFDCRQS